MESAKITARQIKIIHTLKNRLGWSDERYRMYLMAEGDGFATSCKDLSEREAERIIGKMEIEAVARGVWEVRKDECQVSSVEGRRRKYEDLGGRRGMASPKQLRMIEAMWADVSIYREEDKRAMALRKFLHRIIGVDDLRFVEAWQARKIVEAIKTMNRRRYAGITGRED